MYSSSLFLIYSAIAQQINSHHFRISTLGTVELDIPKATDSTSMHMKVHITELRTTKQSVTLNYID